MERREQEPDDHLRDATVAANIGIAAGATAGITTTAATMAARGAAPAAAGSGAKLLAAGIGLAVAGGLIAVGGLLVGDGSGGGSASAPLVMQPMDESIREFEFAGSEFDSGYSVTDLYTEDEAARGLPYTPGVIEHFLVGEPQYGDFDGDNDLDVVHQVSAYAGSGLPSLYIWLWEDGEVVQVPYPAAHNEDCYDMIESFSVVDDLIRVETTSGGLCEASEPVVLTFTVAVEDGYPVQVDPGYGAVKQCAGDFDAVLDEPVDVPLYVAQDTAAPQLDASDVARIEILDREGPYAMQWRLARVTGVDGTINCAWTPRS
ncbi:MAG TPA: hypothetical protein H9881_10390 [Candidatus Stackebrandtia excrementipullorum]|nr:hypothetical protein [Candidatus Stackebrandtia excrementipullorum]